MAIDDIQVARPRAAGVVFVAPTSTNQPTDASTALPSSWTSLGFISEDGIAEVIDDTMQPLREMGGTVVLDLKTATSVSYKLTFLETTADVLKSIFGTANVTESAGGDLSSMFLDGAESPEQSFVFDMRLRGAAVHRICIPRGRVASIGETTYKAGAAITYQVEIAAYPDADGKFVKKFW